MEKHKLIWCELCGRNTVICWKCGNNTCNGGVGTLKDGSRCDTCDDAWLHDNPEMHLLLQRADKQ